MTTRRYESEYETVKPYKYTIDHITDLLDMSSRDP